MLSGSIYLMKSLYMGYNVVIWFFTRRIAKMTYEEIVKGKMNSRYRCNLSANCNKSAEVFDQVK